ncbi:MAG TPA: M23 family metallopeptidase [Candidatus Andersenbacteria bacterium]|nr:M23 family metallopeptidase [Candidatus Andersenbacteria bacterium]
MSIVAQKLEFPIQPYEVTGYRFGQRVRSRMILIARHLGDDILADPGTEVHVIGDGIVVWSEVRLGTPQKRNWGGIVIIEHLHVTTGAKFYSVYGHLEHLAIHVGEEVKLGDRIGLVAKGASPENGFWKLSHLHFGIYTGPWTGKVLPGWLRPFEGRTRFSWWQDPKKFVEGYG